MSSELRLGSQPSQPITHSISSPNIGEATSTSALTHSLSLSTLSDAASASALDSTSLSALLETGSTPFLIPSRDSSQSPSGTLSESPTPSSGGFASGDQKSALLKTKSLSMPILQSRKNERGHPVLPPQLRAEIEEFNKRDAEEKKLIKAVGNYSKIDAWRLNHGAVPESAMLIKFLQNPGTAQNCFLELLKIKTGRKVIKDFILNRDDEPVKSPELYHFLKAVRAYQKKVHDYQKSYQYSGNFIEEDERDIQQTIDTILDTYLCLDFTRVLVEEESKNKTKKTSQSINIGALQKKKIRAHFEKLTSRAEITPTNTKLADGFNPAVTEIAIMLGTDFITSRQYKDFKKKYLKD